MPNLDYERLTTRELQSLLGDIRKTRVAVLGDFCLDVYWFIDRDASEISLETGLSTQPVAEQRCALGGAGNVVNNMVALGCERIEIFGVVGDDPWGREMRRLLASPAIVNKGLLSQEKNWATHTFIKPHIQNEESNRLDFGNFNLLAQGTADQLLAMLAERLPELDLVVINEQVKQGLHDEYFRRRLHALVVAHPEKIFIVDSRHFSDAYSGAYLKVNDREAARYIGAKYPVEALVLKEDAHRAAKALYTKRSKPVFVTRGARGLVVCDDEGLQEIPGIQVLGRIDPVGAGDSTLAGVALALATGTNPVIAATLGNIVASITVQKLHQTGSASPEEVMAAGPVPDYIYRPELAEDPRGIRLIEGTEFEQVSQCPPPDRVTHVIFDHDGTISSLREGWEQIMEPMMIRAILGLQFAAADDSLYHRVVDRVRDYIDKSTGIQTLTQMQGLVKMVREFGCVPEDGILDELGYKTIYNEELMKLVRRRIAKLQRGELHLEDYTIKNAEALLQALHGAGVRLYLASGTDQQDVIAEAKALGYAALFEGRIYGAVGDAAKEAKREVLDRILAEIGSNAPGLVAIGDGPVEIRETHKRGGFSIGIASDELRRFGLNQIKRSRLIRAGADVIIPDYSQLPQLLRLLHIA